MAGPLACQGQAMPQQCYTGLTLVLLYCYITVLLDDIKIAIKPKVQHEQLCMNFNNSAIIDSSASNYILYEI